MTKRPQNPSDQVERRDARHNRAYPDKRRRNNQDPCAATGHGSETPEVRVEPPAFVAITEDQRAAVIRALIDLLAEDQQRHND